jgi:hypothetical protein
MSANKADKNNSNVITNCHNQSIGIAFDVKNDTVVRNNTGITMSGLNIDWTLPISMRSFVVPSF